MDLEIPLDAPGAAAQRQKNNRCWLKLGLSGIVCVICIASITLFQMSSGSSVSPLQRERQEQAQKYMVGRVKASQGSDKVDKASGVAAVLETMVDGLDVAPIIDVQAPTAEHIEGRNEINKYLERKSNGRPFADEDLIAEIFHGNPVVRFVFSDGRRFGKSKHRLVASFEFKEGSALIQKVTIKKDESTPLSALDRERQKMVRKYMEGRIEAFQGSNKAAGVTKVLGCFIPDGTTVKPIIDLHAPKEEYAEGREQIQHYLENPPNLPVKFKEGSNTDPVIADGKATIKFIMRIGIGFVGVDKHLVAVYDFKEGSALVQKVTVVYDDQ